MTDEELVTAGAKAFATVAHQHGGCCPAGVEICMEIGDCMCAESARAVLAAVEPKIRADERERAAKIAEDRNAGLDPPDGGAPTPREMCLNIAVAIRDGKESRND